MINMQIRSNDEEALIALKDKFCDALIGSQGYISNEILVSNVGKADDKMDYSFTFIIGNDNSNNIDINVFADDMETT